MRTRILAVSAILAATLSLPSMAQQRVVTAADYARAERFMCYERTPLVFGTAVRPTWLPDDRFWFRSLSASGADFVVVDPARATRTSVFADTRLAGAVATALSASTEALSQATTQASLSGDGKSVIVAIAGRSVTCDVASTTCRPATARSAARRPPEAGAAAVVAAAVGGRGTWRPRRARRDDVARRHHAARSFATGTSGCATSPPVARRSSRHDGVKDFGYATDNAGWASSDRAILLWSPDSKKIATFQQDERKVGDMYLVETQGRPPELRAWKYPLPGDSVVAMIQRVIID